MVPWPRILDNFLLVSPLIRAETESDVDYLAMPIPYVRIRVLRWNKVLILLSHLTTDL